MTVAAMNVSKSIAERLSRFKVADLRDLARVTGLGGLPTRKADLAAAVGAHLTSHAPGSSNAAPVVLSIDVGYRNLAWALADDRRVHAWRRETLVPAAAEKSESESESETKARIYEPTVFARAVLSLTQNMAGAVTEARAAYGADPAQLHVVIERQRSMGPAQGSLTVFMVNMVEGMLWSSVLHPAFLREPLGAPLRGVSLPPGQVSQWFEHGSTGGKSKSKSKKTAATAMVDRVLRDAAMAGKGELAIAYQADVAQPKLTSSLALDASLAAAFAAEKKRDDMADALLQAAASLDWLRNARDVARRIEAGEAMVPFMYADVGFRAVFGPQDS
ncbi:hypothetical protein H9P43_007657 [Blastocladiella emersonii ATCC 22665]|nr:hypothetical protein H9P43_007657 [Blastocladiella emersonii ATCC 22665]